MIVKDRLSAKSVSVYGIVLLLVGVLIGALLEPIMLPYQSAGDAVREARKDEKHPHPALFPPRVVDNGLDTLYVEIEEANVAVIQSVRDRAVERGVIVQEEEDRVPARVRLGNKTVDAEVRIKGDWTDHVQGEKWSLRFRLKSGKLLGMRTFSVQDPLTRGYLWEWVVHQAAQREGLLAPRSTFVNLVVNNNDNGIFFLEEHFSKEMLESQSRREGPILILDEGSIWSVYLQNYIGKLGFGSKIPQPFQPALTPSRAEIRAYGTNRMAAVENLNRTLVTGLDKMRKLQNLVIASDGYGDRLSKWRALEDLQAATVEQILATEQWARAHALYSLFQIWHGLIWHNLRFYFNPVTERLEPIIFDNMPHSVKSREPVYFRAQRLTAEITKSPTYTRYFFQDLARYAGADYLEGLFKDLEPDFTRFSAALNAEKTLPSSHLPDAIKQRLRAQQTYLQNLLFPTDPVNFSCFLKKESGPSNTIDGILEIRAWTTTKIPVLLSGFRFENGQFVSARSCLDDAAAGAIDRDGSVILPSNGMPYRFRLPINRRLTNLSQVAGIVKSARADTGEEESWRLDEVQAVYRPVSATTDTAEPLMIVPRAKAWQEEGGRPPPPDLTQALNRYPCLNYHSEDDRLWLRPGKWTLNEDLLIPRGYSLHAGPNIHLRFAEGRVLLSEGPLIFHGTKDGPVILEPAEGAAHWAGVIVLGAPERSTWENVIVRNSNSLTRGGWMTTGGVTFYHSAVDLRDCRFEGTLAEDGLNLFGTDFLMERVTFSGCISDSFDGDFVTGTMRDCIFENGKADGVDFSGSTVELVGCHFKNLGDKAISAGEKSQCRVSGGTVRHTRIGVASKDSSHVAITGTSFSDITHFALAAYVKKAEYGPSSIEAVAVTIDRSPPSLVQTGCELWLNGQKARTQSFDVDRMYDEKVLGN